MAACAPKVQRSHTRVVPRRPQLSLLCSPRGHLPAPYLALSVGGLVLRPTRGQTSEHLPCVGYPRSGKCRYQTALHRARHVC